MISHGPCTLTPCVNIAGFPDSNISSNSSFVVVRPAAKIIRSFSKYSGTCLNQTHS